MSKIIALICYWNGKVIAGKKGISYEAPPPTATVIRSRVTFDEFIDKLYHMIGHEKQYTRLGVTLDIRWQKLRIIDQDTPLGNSLEVYIDSITQNPSHQGADLSFNGLSSSHPVYDYHEGGTSYLWTDICEVSPNDSDNNDVSQKLMIRKVRGPTVAHAMSI